MSRRLYLLRHAKSSWSGDAPTDFERPLAKRGKRDAPRIGAWLVATGHVPDYVVSSPARRARKTAIKACRELSIQKAAVHWHDGIYGASPEGLLRILGECPSSACRVLLVGHNPGLEELLHYLTRGRMGAGDGKDGTLPTAALACITLPDDWTALMYGAGSLLFLVRPRALPEPGSFTLERPVHHEGHGGEQR